MWVNLGASERLASLGQAPSPPSGHLGPKPEGLSETYTCLRQRTDRELSRVAEHQSSGPGGLLSLPLCFIGEKTGQEGGHGAGRAGKCPQHSASLSCPPQGSLVKGKLSSVAIADLAG